jgi:hypothetical protein
MSSKLKLCSNLIAEYTFIMIWSLASNFCQNSKDVINVQHYYKLFGWWEVDGFLKQLCIHTWNLKTVRNVIKFLLAKVSVTYQPQVVLQSVCIKDISSVEGLDRSSRTHSLAPQIPRPYCTRLIPVEIHGRQVYQQSLPEQNSHAIAMLMTHQCGEHGKHLIVALTVTESLMEHVLNIST